MSKKRKKKKLRLKPKYKILFLLFLLLLGIITFKLFYNKKEPNKPVEKEEIPFNPDLWQQNLNPEENPISYETIKIDSLDTYPGIGQKIVPNKDGYFTTFTTKTKRKYIEYKQNGASSWINNPYWDSTMEKTGCGITTMSIILSGYGYKLTPEDLRKKYYPVFDYSKLPNELRNEYDLENSGFIYGSSKQFSKEKIISHLKTNNPIIVCISASNGNNRWTRGGHYMALLAETDGDMIYISNPNGLYESSKSSGWYHIDELFPYIYSIIYINQY